MFTVYQKLLMQEESEIKIATFQHEESANFHAGELAVKLMITCDENRRISQGYRSFDHKIEREMHWSDDCRNLYDAFFVYDEEYNRIAVFYVVEEE